MTIRPATADDVDAIRAVAERAWETDYPDILTRETATTGVADWYDRETLRDEVDRKKTLLLVAERETEGKAEASSEIVGFAHANWRNEEGYLLRVYVDPDHRRQGLGRDLLVETCDRLFAHEVEQVSAMVLSANEPGRAFYEHFGFAFEDEAETTIGGERYPESRYVLADRGQLTVE
jgi:ribosomal protein S18 acetylase RimI-like enzyme